MKDIDSTRAIHITGTKGKGSTCAFTESILRNHGFKTGFFSSPHLIEVRERIRINGKPLSRNLFAQHFWECYQAMEKAKVITEIFNFFNKSKRKLIKTGRKCYSTAALFSFSYCYGL